MSQLIRGFGLAFDVVKAGTLSGFAPAPVRPPLAHLRLEGFAAGLRVGFVEHLTIIGGTETWGQNRAEAIWLMLTKDYGIDHKKVSWRESRGNTMGNAEIISEICTAHGIDMARMCVISNHYHLVRSLRMLQHKGVTPGQMVAAESLILLENPDREAEILEGMKAVAEELLAATIGEIRGLKDLFPDNTTYQSRRG